MNVIPINGNKNKVNQDTIDILSTSLKLAKEGKIVAFAGVSLTDNNELNNIYSGDIHGNYLSIQGMLNDLSSELKNNYEKLL